MTFVYEAHSRREVPLGPKIVRIRTDVEWSDVVRSAWQEERFLNGIQEFLLFLPPSSSSSSSLFSFPFLDLN